MYQNRFFALFIIISCMAYTGCAYNPASSNVTNIPIEQNKRLASLRVILSPETAGNLRAAATSNYYVEAILAVGHPGSETNTYSTVRKVADISNSTATINFTSVPAGPALVKIQLTNGTINNERSFHAAVELQPGNNTTVTPVAVNSGSETDIKAKVMEYFINAPELMKAASNDLYSKIASASEGVSDYLSAVNNTVIAINPDGMIKLVADTDRITLKGYNGDTESWSKTTADLFNDNSLWTSTPGSMQIKSILGQGIGGYSHIAFNHASENDNVIVKLATSNGSKLASVKNYGAINHYLVLADNSIIAAGYNNYKNAPVLFRWKGNANANTCSISSADSGLNWVTYFNDVASYGTVANFNIESIVSDLDSTLHLKLTDTSNKIIEYRVNLNTGKRIYIPGSIEEAIYTGVNKISSAYSDMQTILQNNNLTNSQRVAGFMAYIADDFKDIAGTPNRNELESTMLSRLQRYTIDSYSFNKTKVQIVDSSTIKVTTPMTVGVTLKPGMSGAVNGFNGPVDPVPVFTWKLYGTTWKIHQGLPYKRSEVGF